MPERQESLPDQPTQNVFEKEIKRIQRNVTVRTLQFNNQEFISWDDWESQDWLRQYSDEECLSILQQSPVTPSSIDITSLIRNDETAITPTWSSLLHHLAGRVLKDVLATREARKWLDRSAHKLTRDQV